MGSDRATSIDSAAAEELWKLRTSLRNTPSPEVAWIRSLDGVADPEGVLRLLLLRSALDHGLGLRPLNALSTRLWEECGESLWSLPVIRQATLESLFSSLSELDRWMLREQLSGIVWSVGRFIRHRRSLLEWIKGPPEEVLAQAAEEIFWFGRHSAERLKGRRFLFLAQLPEPWGAGVLRSADQWVGWRFPVWRNSLRFWSAHRKELGGTDAAFSRIEVAERLTQFCLESDHLDPIGLGYAARWYGEVEPQ